MHTSEQQWPVLFEWQAENGIFLSVLFFSYICRQLTCAHVLLAADGKNNCENVFRPKKPLFIYFICDFWFRIQLIHDTMHGDEMRDASVSFTLTNIGSKMNHNNRSIPFFFLELITTVHKHIS